MTSYLDQNLKPLIQSIKPKYSESYILEAFGLKRISSQSFLISVGNQLENFWNKVISDSERNNNLIEEDNMVNVAGKLRLYKKKNKSMPQFIIEDILIL